MVQRTGLTKSSGTARWRRRRRGVEVAVSGGVDGEVEEREKALGRPRLRDYARMMMGTRWFHPRARFCSKSTVEVAQRRGLTTLFSDGGEKFRKSRRKQRRWGK